MDQNIRSTAPIICDNLQFITKLYNIHTNLYIITICYMLTRIIIYYCFKQKDLITERGGIDININRKILILDTNVFFNKLFK